MNNVINRVSITISIVNAMQIVNFAYCLAFLLNLHCDAIARWRIAQKEV